MNMGWLKLHRRLLNWEWYRDVNTKTVFVHLLLTANYGVSKHKGFTLSEGQRITSVSEVSAETGLTIREVRTAFEHLKSTNELTIKTTNKFSLVTLVNWRLYQTSTDEATNETASEPTSRRQTDDKLNKRNREGKEIPDARFDKFWSAYPRKVAKKNAFAAFKKINPDDSLLSEILAALTAQRNNSDWTQDNGKFIPYPATWLNSERWLDEQPDETLPEQPRKFIQTGIDDVGNPTGEWRDTA